MTVRLHSLPVSTLLLAILGLVFALNPAQAAKNFPVRDFSYYLSDYDYQLGKLAKTVTKTEAEIATDIATAETAGNARLAAASTEQFLTRRPGDAGLWLQFARRLAASTAINDQDGYALPGLMIGAGLRAYQMAATPQDRRTSQK